MLLQVLPSPEHGLAQDAASVVFEEEPVMPVPAEQAELPVEGINAAPQDLSSQEVDGNSVLKVMHVA